MGLSDMTMGAAWLLCCVFATLRVYFIEKSRATQCPLPKATPQQKRMAGLVFVLSLVTSVVMFFLLSYLLGAHLLDAFGEDVDNTAALLFFMLGGALLLLSCIRQLTIILAPAAGGALTIALIQFFSSWMNSLESDMAPTNAIITVFIAVAWLGCAALAAFQYLNVMKQAARKSA